jgi:hypothetical protein
MGGRPAPSDDRHTTITEADGVHLRSPGNATRGCGSTCLCALKPGAPVQCRPTSGARAPFPPARARRPRRRLRRQPANHRRRRRSRRRRWRSAATLRAVTARRRRRLARATGVTLPVTGRTATGLAVIGTPPDGEHPYRLRGASARADVQVTAVVAKPLGVAELTLAADLGVAAGPFAGGALALGGSTWTWLDGKGTTVKVAVAAAAPTVGTGRLTGPPPPMMQGSWLPTGDRGGASDPGSTRTLMLWARTPYAWFRGLQPAIRPRSGRSLRGASRTLGQKGRSRWPASIRRPRRVLSCGYPRALRRPR